MGNLGKQTEKEQEIRVVEQADMVERIKVRKIMNGKNSRGGVTKRIGLSKAWLNHIGICDDEYVETELLDDSIVIRKVSDNG